MFQSSGFFKNVHCPFYKHDLCHRPYCHYKHIKSRKEKEKEKDDAAENNNADSAESYMEIIHKSRKRTPSPIDAVNDDVLKIVKNISPTKLIEYAKRKQEVQELQQTLEQVDKESKEGPSTLPSIPTEIIQLPSVHVESTGTIRSAEEIKRGLIDSFYSKAKVDVNITSGDIVDKPKEATKVCREKGSKKERIICNCDDPDCSGFREETEDNHITHVNIDQVEDEYMRRKMQRRLNRKKKALTQSETFSFGIPQTNENITDVNICEADFFMPPDIQADAETVNGVDEDLSNYIDKCKAEYAMKKGVKIDKKRVLTDTEHNNLQLEKRLSPDVEKQRTSEKKTNEDTKVSKKKSRSSSIEKKKVLSDIDFFSTVVTETDDNETVSKNDKIITKKSKPPETVTNGSKDVDTERNLNKKKSENISSIENNSSVLKTSETKVEGKKKRVFFPNEVPEKSKTVQRSDKHDNNKIEKSNSDKKIKTNSVSKVNNDQTDDVTSEKKKVNTTSKVDEKLDERTLDKKKKVNSSSKLDDKSDDVTSEKKKKINVSAKLDDKLDEVVSDKKKKANTSTKVDDKLDETTSEKKKKSNPLTKTDDKLDDRSPDKKKKTNLSTNKVDNDKIDGTKSDKKLKTDHTSKHDDVKSDHNTKTSKLDNSKLEKSNSDKNLKTNHKHDTERLDGKSDKKIKTNLSTKQDSSNSKRKTMSSDETVSHDKKRKKRTHTDSESSNGSRNAFDIIAVSSSDDEVDGNSDVEDLCTNDITNSPEYTSRTDRRSSSCSDRDDNAMSSTSYADMKKRVAVTKDVIHRKPVQPHKPKSLRMSYVSPNLKPEDSAPKPVVKPTVTESSMHHDTPSTGKKRIAHVKTTPIFEKTEERPKLEVDIGGKIPHLLRQKYFDKVIDELIPKLATKKEAFDKGIAEEADAYRRSNRKQIYINLCANIVKRVRSMPDYVRPKEPSVSRADPMRTAQPTTKSIKPDLQRSNSKSKVVETVKSTASVSRIQTVTTAGYQKIDPKSTIPKNCIKPASSKLINATTEVARPSGKRERSDSLTLEPMELTEDNFYEHMQQYLLTKEQLWNNRYPRRDPDNPYLTQIKDYTPSANTLKRLCCRCGKEYFMNKKGKYVTRNECHYHWGKLLRQRGRNSNTMIYTCCGVDSGGLTCAMCRLHVCNKVGALENYVSTEACENKDSKRKVFALDCEMCYTTQGLELTRLTVIDFDMEQIIDLFVKPANPIVDYNTRFSGVTREDLAEVSTTINDIHDILLNMIDKDTILMGHSLESDLNALNIIHEKVVDTAIVFPHRMGLPLKRALRNLMVEYLQKVIQSGDGGHDSCEDARSCMELMKYKFKEDQKLRKRLKSN